MAWAEDDAASAKQPATRAAQAERVWRAGRMTIPLESNHSRAVDANGFP